MTTTYVAWNGQSYPWPPPEGWYEASDGQWWAPGTGPIPLHPVAPAWTAVAPPPERPTPTPIVSATDAAEDHGPTGPLPTMAATADPPRERPRRTAALLAIGAVAAVIVAGVALISLSGNDNPTTGEEAAGSADTDTDTDDPTDPSIDADGPGPATSVPTDDGGHRTSSDRSTTTSTGRSTTSTSPSETSPTSGSTSSAATTATTVTATTAPGTAQEAAVVRFRELLAADGLDSALLSDANMRDFGNAFCVFAAVADDGAAFSEFRARTVAGQGSGDPAAELSPSDMARTVDAAVAAFCPAEAQRLGLAS